MWQFGTAVIVVQAIQMCRTDWPDPRIRSKGSIWPHPQFINSSETAVMNVGVDAFTFTSTLDHCEIIDKAIDRYHKRLFGNKQTRGRRWIREASEAVAEHQEKSNDEILRNLTIIVDGGCTDDYPQFGMDESYKLSITNEGAVLRSAQVWGALRGLESFAHLLFNDSTKIRRVEIRDFPRFLHRGVLLDTSRHYLSLDALKVNIELMAQNKFNTFHWHIVDIESFPYKSEALPSLIQGAYTPNHVYTLAQIKDIINYARLRGIRVLPEFDTPGHMKSWGVGIKDLLATCYDPRGAVIQHGENILDPTNADTWDVLAALFEEVFSTFPDNYVHLGGDEADFWMTQCWLQNPNISQFMQTYGLRDVHSLQVWYFRNFITLLHSLRSGMKKKFLVWQEALEEMSSTNQSFTDDGLIAHIWKSNEGIQNATAKGYDTILSACWYLDRIAPVAEWIQYYMCDPQNYAKTEDQKRLVLGGEAALWGEWVDDSNVVSRLWPRATAVAERLWSSAAVTNITEAWLRLYEMQCRMAAQGYPAAPAGGPGFCEHEYKINLPVPD